ncbi:sesquipedalian-1 [Falco biarmicus]|uniref:sesquipedalian-1 n=1 Tax=Falco cherrug TaxID=345164 RepID=UPI000392DD1C|nr:sesquipedalian-1 [Falco cherrug]XP_037231477.1 sesquipedalian-1 [Falco rusticolus]XP_055556923.1 sesquipedalian-1 [Falco cherrug]XP_056182714.1 sesquipedalian-1 [Falco biarmicus]XP_056182715.1 sesquipedalian-1 [Falco biarmicus]
MKLNERSLAFYATCDSPADNTGFLYKRGERHTAYHRRWFVLKGNMLFYFEERESREPLGVIVLEGCTVELCDSAEEFSFAIRFGGAKSRTYVLAAESQAAMESWVKSLSRASFDYMRLVVRALEKQLEEMRWGPAGGCSGCQGLPGSWKPKPMGLERSPERLPALPTVLPKENGCAVWNNVPGADRLPGASGCTRHDSEGNLRPPPLPPRRRASSSEAGSARVAAAESLSTFCQLHEQYGREVAQLRQDWLERRRGPRP